MSAVAVSLEPASFIPAAARMQDGAPIDRFYYLANFKSVLAWVSERYGDLLDANERAFVERFGVLPRASQALLVRMAMRKGSVFRASKLRYEEIGDTQTAATPLCKFGWLEHDPPLDVKALFGLLTKPECAHVLGLPTAWTKDALLEKAQALHDDARRFSAWCPESREVVYALHTGALFDRLRLMFFGNLYQDWSEFVLADLGMWEYEKVSLAPGSRAFEARADVDAYLALDACREVLDASGALDAIESDLSLVACTNAWLEGKRAKLLFRIGQEYERQAAWKDALRVYEQCGYPGARARRVRVLEKDGQHGAAMALAEQAMQAPESEAELQQVLRMAPRLRRRLGLPKQATATLATGLPRIDLELPCVDGMPVELAAAAYFQEEDADSAVHYVENTLLNSLFGLLCWDAIFAALPGAFFHPFQAGPADLHDADFHARRAPLFAACLAELDDGRYLDTMRTTYARKRGIVSPFVAWDALDDTLLSQALDCLPPAHLKLWFARMLRDLNANCAGFPDLIQFWPQEKRYRLVEVKGPGDRLQDNQLRLLDFCLAHGMPVAACYVQWQDQALRMP